MRASRRLDFAERWMRDGIDVCRVPAYFVSLDVDMSEAQSLIEQARRRGTRLTYGHIFVRATALALAANQDLHEMVCGRQVYNPGQVDIALSIAGESAAAPLLVLQGADRKNLTQLADEIVNRAPEVRDSERKMLAALRRWGWLVPWGLMRRWLLRAMFRNAAFRRKGAGTFQVSVLSDVDRAMSPLFTATAALIAGSVKDRVIAICGRAVVRPTVTLTCCADHRIWDGRAGERFLQSVRQILESTTLYDEFDSAYTADRAVGRATRLC